MLQRLRIHARTLAFLAVVGLTVSTSPSAFGQFGHSLFGHGRDHYYCPPGTHYHVVPGTPIPSEKHEAAAPRPDDSTPSAADTAGDFSLPSERSFAAGGPSVSLSDSNVGYIDSALIRSHIRLRFDSAYDNVRPDRAEFFYAQCGCFPNAPGPGQPERSVDYQDFSTYIEMAASESVSGFIEVPLRFLNPEVNGNTAGMADLHLGLKYAVWQDCCSTLTFQLRGILPTGDADRGLGTDHGTLVPGLLYHEKLSECLTAEGEFQWFIPIDGVDGYEGDVIRYGLGLGYEAYRDCSMTVTPIVELVGWTVLDGQALAVTPTGNVFVEDAEGDTIVNIKLGSRINLGSSDLYLGYGRALTGDTWYQDLFRMEWRMLY